MKFVKWLWVSSQSSFSSSISRKKKLFDFWNCVSFGIHFWPRQSPKDSSSAWKIRKKNIIIRKLVKLPNQFEQVLIWRFFPTAFSFKNLSNVKIKMNLFNQIKIVDFSVYYRVPLKWPIYKCLNFKMDYDYNSISQIKHVV